MSCSAIMFLLHLKKVGGILTHELHNSHLQYVLKEKTIQDKCTYCILIIMTTIISITKQITWRVLVQIKAILDITERRFVLHLKICIPLLFQKTSFRFHAKLEDCKS